MWVNIQRMLLLWLADACLAMRLLHCKPLWCCDGEKNEGEGLYRWLRSEFLEGGIPVLGNEKVVEAGSGWKGLAFFEQGQGDSGKWGVCRWRNGMNLGLQKVLPAPPSRDHLLTASLLRLSTTCVCLVLFLLGEQNPQYDPLNVRLVH